LNPPAINNSRVEKYRHDQEVIRHTASQIIKDFELFGIEIKFSGNEQVAYEELKSQIIPALNNLYKNNYSLFNSLLYRIDVEERKVEYVIHSIPKEYQAEELSKLILEREFIKAIFKKVLQEFINLVCFVICKFVQNS
jgi:hypothetical protein